MFIIRRTNFDTGRIDFLESTEFNVVGYYSPDKARALQFETLDSAKRVIDQQLFHVKGDVVIRAVPL